MKKNGFQYLFLWIMLIATVLIISNFDKKMDKLATAVPSLTPAPTQIINVGEASEIETKNDEMVGIWVPFMSLETAEGTEKSFKSNFELIIEKAKEINVNTLFVHVRPFSDALYNSKLYPWSHIITGTQGKDPEFDPLDYMIKKAHDNNLKLHAWINPLRVKTPKTPKVVSEDNPYAQLSESNPYYFINIKGNVYLNPAYSEMRSLISDGVKEIVENYDVDGIHFDDYFYPDNMGEEDSEAYSAYSDNTDSPLTLGEWRTANINALVSEVYRTIKGLKKDLPFGISPQGNINNNEALGADVFSWCSTKGYIDYICPQLYFSYDNPSLGFTKALDSWLNIARHDNLKIYIGLGLYKAGTDSDNGTWENDSDTIAKQIKDIRVSACDGFIIYDILAMESKAASAEVGNMKEVLSEIIP